MTRTSAVVHGRRLERLLESVTALGGNGAMISAPAMVAALSGVWLETGEIMPSRNPWLLAGADGSLVLLVDEIEGELAVRRCALESVQITTYRGGAERLDAARSWIGGGARRPVGVATSGISAADLRGLDAEIVDIAHLADTVGREKSPDEIAIIGRAAAAMATAVTAACADPGSVGATESAVAGTIAGYIYQTGEQWYSVVPIVSSGSNLRVPHARPGGRKLSRGDLCRIGARGRFGPFHVMYVRTAVVGQDRLDLGASALAGLAAAHDRTVRALRPGATAALCPEATGDGTLARIPVPVAQGIGFEFKEPPRLDTGSADRLEPGDVVLVSTILQRSAGDRLYQQQMAAVVTNDVVLLEEIPMS